MKELILRTWVVKKSREEQITKLLEEMETVGLWG